VLTALSVHGGAENAAVENEGVGAYSRMQFLTAVSHSMGAHTEALCPTADSSSSSHEDETYEASPATTSESSESPATAAAATDDCCKVCLVAPREGFALVPCGHARFCQSCALRVADLDSCCPVCRAPTRMVMRVFFLMTLCTRDVIVKILCRLCTAV